MKDEYLKSKFGEEKRKRRGVYLECDTCKKQFYVFLSRLKQANVKYCSQKCRKRDGYNNPFYGKKHTKKSIAKMLNNPNRHVFGKGESNPNYVRFGENYVGITRGWWIRYLLRKYGKCQRCGFDDKRILILHHKNKNTKNNVKKNLLLLCPNCHSIVHYEDNSGIYKNLNAKYYEEKIKPRCGK